MIGDEIIKLLGERGALHVRQICDALDRDYVSVMPAITACVRRELIIAVGTAADYGHTGVKASARMYALPGTEALYKRESAPHSEPMSDRIRNALADGPLTTEELAQRVGMPTTKVRKAAFDMASKGSGVVVLYALHAETQAKVRTEIAVEASKPLPARAEPITIGRGSKWWVGRA